MQLILKIEGFKYWKKSQRGNFYIFSLMVSGKKSISFTQNFSMQFWKYASYLWSRFKRGKRGNLTYLKWKSLICLKALYVTNQTVSNYRKQNNWSEVGKIFFSKRKTILPNCNFRMKTLQQFATFNLSFCSLSDCFYCRYFYNKNTTKKFIYFKKINIANWLSFAIFSNFGMTLLFS